MPITMTVKDVGPSLTQLRVVVQLAFSGSYPTGGDTLDLTTIIGQGAGGVGIAVFNNGPILVLDNLAGGYDGEFIAGSALNNGKFKIWASGGTEISAGAYSSVASTLTTDTNSQAELIFDKLL